MSREEIKEKLLSEKNARLILVFNYKDRQYAKTIKVDNDEINTVYFEIEEDMVREVLDEKTLLYFKDKYEIEKNNKIF